MFSAVFANSFLLALPVVIDAKWIDTEEHGPACLDAEKNELEGAEDKKVRRVQFNC